MIRVCAYIDGFNLYHAIDKLNDNRLKWLDLNHLTQEFLDSKIHKLEKIYYFSAFATWKKDAVKRHHTYEKALRLTGITTVMGKFKNRDRQCLNCKTKWIAHEEKETDVNIALRLLDDAYQDKYDEAIIISQDSDLFPAISLVKKHFPNKEIKIITPPNMKHSKRMANIVGKKKLGKIKKIHLERSILPSAIKNEDGATTIIIPSKYKRP